MPSLEEIKLLQNAPALKANDLLAIADVSATTSGSVNVRKAALALIGQGFTHAFRIDYNNTEILAQGVDDTDEEITLMAIPANCVVNRVRLVVTTAFAGLTACNVFVGRTADTDGYIASASVLDKTVVENTGAEIDVVNELDVITASDQNLLITFDPGANAEALDELTAGSLVVLVSLTEIADYANITTAQ